MTLERRKTKHETQKNKKQKTQHTTQNQKPIAPRPLPRSRNYRITESPTRPITRSPNHPITQCNRPTTQWHNCPVRNSIIPVAIVCGLMLGGSACKSNTPTTPTPPVTPTTTIPPAAPTVTAVTVNGTSTFTERGASAQFTAIASLSNGTTEDRTASATWQSDNTVVAIVTGQGLVTAGQDGDTNIAATVSNVRGSRGISVRAVRRTPDPPAGQRLPMHDVRAFVEAAAAARPDLLAQSCPRGLKYVTNPWLDYMVDRLRTLDTRWGYNGKPTRTAADNEGVPVVAAGDEVAYHFSGGPDEGSPDVYLIDILLGHCGDAPAVTYRVFTGEEPGRWTGAGRLQSASPSTRD